MTAKQRPSKPPRQRPEPDLADLSAAPATQPGHPGLRVAPADRVRFAHDSERQLARLFDFYGVVWEYEPTEFVLARDEQGRPTEAFRPDFYLPVYDIYVELTTLNQKLVTKKNRKIRRLKELRPDVDVRILYQRDCHALLGRHIEAAGAAS